MSSNLSYRSRAVRAMVLLHEDHLRRFLSTWRLALETSVTLPTTADPAYSSLDALGRHVLREIPDEQLETPEYPSRWKTRYCIDAMLEHAVMHPIRHTFQLDELMKDVAG